MSFDFQGRLPLRAETWAAAYQLGNMRRDSRNGRNSEQDRGDERNFKNDVSGAVSELVLLREFLRRGERYGAHDIANGLYMPLLRKVSDTPWFDIKTTLAEGSRRRILVNARQHESMEHDYVFFRMAWLGKDAVASAIVKHCEVTRWPKVDLGYGSPAHSMWVDDFVSAYMGGLHPSQDAFSRCEVAEVAGIARQGLQSAMDWGNNPLDSGVQCG